MSSSAISPQIENETASASGSDSKKRNKLGYHRTAVACGHCRRRKIRCIPSADQTESRCQNCIRLKKECQFYPVEGEDANTRKSKSELGADSSVGERDAPKDSSSPDPVASTHGSYDIDVIADAPSNTVQTHAHGIVASPPPGVGSEHIQMLPDWGVHSTQVHTQNVYHPQHSQSPSAPAQAYWFANDPTALAYQQQQFGLANASALPSQDPQLQHSNRDIESRLDAARPGFGSMPTHNIGQSLRTYHQYGNTFPGMHRSVTMPALQTQSNSNIAEMGMQTSPQIAPGQGHGQYVYNPAYSPQFTHGAHWYPPPNDQQPFPPHYLPSQRDPNSDHPEWPG